MRWNSFWLLVTKVAPSARAWQAIHRPLPALHSAGRYLGLGETAPEPARPVAQAVAPGQKRHRKLNLFWQRINANRSQAFAILHWQGRIMVVLEGVCEGAVESGQGCKQCAPPLPGAGMNEQVALSCARNLDPIRGQAEFRRDPHSLAVTIHKNSAWQGSHQCVHAGVHTVQGALLFKPSLKHPLYSACRSRCGS